MKTALPLLLLLSAAAAAALPGDGGKLNCPSDHTFRVQVGPSQSSEEERVWFVNGVPEPHLTLQRGQSYNFLVEGGAENPFFILHPKENTEAPVSEIDAYTNSSTPVSGRLCLWSVTEPGPLSLFCEKGEPGNFSWTSSSQTPSTLFYQSFGKEQLGGKIKVVEFCEETRPSLYLESSLLEHTIDTRQSDQPLPEDDGELEREVEIREHEIPVHVKNFPIAAGNQKETDVSNEANIANRLGLQPHDEPERLPPKFLLKEAEAASSIKNAAPNVYHSQNTVNKPQFEGGFIPLVVNPIKEKEVFKRPPLTLNLPQKPFQFNESIPFHGIFKPGVPDFSGFNISNFPQEKSYLPFNYVQENMPLPSAPRPHLFTYPNAPNQLQLGMFRRQNPPPPPPQMFDRVPQNKQFHYNPALNPAMNLHPPNMINRQNYFPLQQNQIAYKAGVDDKVVPPFRRAFPTLRTRVNQNIPSNQQSRPRPMIQRRPDNTHQLMANAPLMNQRQHVLNNQMLPPNMILNAESQIQMSELPKYFPSAPNPNSTPRNVSDIENSADDNEKLPLDTHLQIPAFDQTIASRLRNPNSNVINPFKNEKIVQLGENKHFHLPLLEESNIFNVQDKNLPPQINIAYQDNGNRPNLNSPDKHRDQQSKSNPINKLDFQTTSLELTTPHSISSNENIPTINYFNNNPLQEFPYEAEEEHLLNENAKDDILSSESAIVYKDESAPYGTRLKARPMMYQLNPKPSSGSTPNRPSNFIRKPQLHKEYSQDSKDTVPDSSLYTQKENIYPVFKNKINTNRTLQIHSNRTLQNPENIHLPEILEKPPSHDNGTDYSILNHVLSMIGG